MVRLHTYLHERTSIGSPHTIAIGKRNSFCLCGFKYMMLIAITIYRNDSELGEGQPAHKNEQQLSHMYAISGSLNGMQSCCQQEDDGNGAFSYFGLFLSV